jgi:hypothetical protein
VSAGSLTELENKHGSSFGPLPASSVSLPDARCCSRVPRAITASEIASFEPMLTASCQHNNTSCSRLSLTMYDDLTIEEWIETTASKHETLSSPRIAAESSTPCANAKRCAPDEPCLRPYPTPEPQPKRRRKTCSMDDGLRLYDIDATPRAATIRPLVQQSFDSGLSSTTSSQASVTSRGSKRSRSGAASPSKRAILRALPQPIHIHTYRESVVHLDAPLGFKELVDKILDYAEGLSTVPDEFKVRSLHTKLVTPHPALLIQPVFV